MKTIFKIFLIIIICALKIKAQDNSFKVTKFLYKNTSENPISEFFIVYQFEKSDTIILVKGDLYTMTYKNYLKENGKTKSINPNQLIKRITNQQSIKELYLVDNSLKLVNYKMGKIDKKNKYVNYFALHDKEYFIRKKDKIYFNNNIYIDTTMKITPENVFYFQDSIISSQNNRSYLTNKKIENNKLTYCFYYLNESEEYKYSDSSLSYDFYYTPGVGIIRYIFNYKSDYLLIQINDRKF